MDQHLIDTDLENLMGVKFPDTLEALIRLAHFKMFAAADGYRGRIINLTVRDGKVVYDKSGKKTKLNFQSNDKFRGEFTTQKAVEEQPEQVQKQDKKDPATEVVKPLDVHEVPNDGSAGVEAEPEPVMASEAEEPRTGKKTKKVKEPEPPQRKGGKTPRTLKREEKKAKEAQEGKEAKTQKSKSSGRYKKKKH